MKRPNLFLFSAAVVIILIAVVAAQREQPRLLILERAAKAAGETPPRAILIEMGVKDLNARDWSGQAEVNGAKVVHREGYRFRKEDRLIEPSGWKAGSHRGLRVPPKQPQVSKMERIATVGVVLHLADIAPDATLTIKADDKKEKATLPVKDVLAGNTVPLWNNTAEVRLISTATPVVTGKTEDDFPAAAYGPDGTIWLAYISYTLRDESRRIEQHSYKEQPENFKALYHPEFADQLFVKHYRDGKWSEPHPITGAQEDLGRCAIRVRKNGVAQVYYSANRTWPGINSSGMHTIFYRLIAKGDAGLLVSPEQGPIKGRFSHLNPVICVTDGDTSHLAYQSWMRDGGAIITEKYGGDMYSLPTIGGENYRKTTHGTSWHPDMAAGPGGEWSLVHDTYKDGHYSVYLHRFNQGGITPDMLIAGSSKFQARPSVAYDAKGRIWIAYEEGPELWGKDYGALVPNKGNPLYNARSVRVVCLDNGKLFKPAELPTSRHGPVTPPFDPQKTHLYEGVNTRYAYPRIGIDGKGRIWLTYRENFGSRYTSHPGTYWLTFARRLEGDHWSGPIELHHSDGLLDSRPVLLPHPSGGLLVFHNTDGRYTTPETINNDIYQSYVDLPGEPAEPVLVPHDPGEPDETLVQRAKKEAEDVKRIRAYRMEATGKKYQLLRGEFHRHTEISWDGGGDGSLEDMFRYAIDAAALDWIGNGDHDSGAGREYSWWLIQKFSDAYHVPGRFTPMFTYERSVAYPMGHRNCMFAKRGVMTLPRLAAPQGEAVGGVSADDTKMLYRYLHEMDGVCASHTSATSMGTDWRDNDPAVEPIVEIYQGDRMSYEMENAPRAGHDPKSGALPINIAGWFPRGFVNHALEKGYRLGFQASSDHWSTHISFFIVLAERNERQAILDAVKKRHCYGATDNIIVDFKSGEHVMGDEFTINSPPTLQFYVRGTNDLAKIDILQDSRVVHTIRPRSAEYRGSWTAPAAAGESHYYYLRVEQSDGEMAWASPMWIRQGQ
jgi:hypothetical protein